MTGSGEQADEGQRALNEENHRWRAHVEWCRTLKPLQLVLVKWFNRDGADRWHLTVVESVDWEGWRVRLKGNGFTGSAEIGGLNLKPYEGDEHSMRW